MEAYTTGLAITGMKRTKSEPLFTIAPPPLSNFRSQSESDLSLIQLSRRQSPLSSEGNDNSSQNLINRDDAVSNIPSPPLTESSGHSSVSSGVSLVSSGVSLVSSGISVALPQTPPRFRTNDPNSVCLSAILDVKNNLRPTGRRNP